jgi:hypothetical protein
MSQAGFIGIGIERSSRDVRRLAQRVVVCRDRFAFTRSAAGVSVRRS